METHNLRDLPFSTLFRRLADQLSALIRQEFAMVRHELTKSLRTTLRSLVLFGIAAVFALCALFSLTYAAIAALATVTPLWAAGLIVTAIAGLSALLCVIVGVRILRRVSAPTLAMRSVEEDLRWVSTRVKSAKH